MYSGLQGRYTYLPLRKFPQVEAVQERTDAPVILHLHWEDRMFAKSRNREGNKATLDWHIEHMNMFRERGGRILWTIHNRTPHANRDPETFAEARSALVDVADRIHVHSDHARNFVVDTLGAAPEKCRVIAHPSYLGFYEPAETTLARPLPDGPVHFLQFGVMRGQKGIGHLSEATHLLQTRRPDNWKLTIAGRTPRNMRRLVKQISRLPMVTTLPDYVPTADVPEIFGSAHAFVAPFSEVFSSGSIALGLTFGLPVIGPDGPVMQETLPEKLISLLYPPNQTRRLMRRMAQVLDVDNVVRQVWREAAFEQAFAHRPEIISGQLGELLDEICEIA
ncbi:hypothetical protein POI8812_00624 [Pontivivens insulae]|uniref:Uncharacterized protein n=2 Tax=Pontivivens insulae TaxID=1639689 RepID=A0A2R8A805_9RHOB|nr:glycosyltransferase involved in cell wall biosynthesis [Pontivivens insulae]SPF28326.1 hypothetical protein POI8812_00624 [Pontivivens insulae]